MIKVKTFVRFEKNKPLNLDNDDLYESFVCDNMKFTLRRYLPVNGHDDTLPYQADLYLNGKGLCHCFNDGWGGETLLTPMGRATMDKIKSIDEQLKENYSWVSADWTFKLTLDFIADSIACCKEYQR